MPGPGNIVIDEARHVALSALTNGYATLAPAPTDHGRLTGIVRRLEDGTREQPETAVLDVTHGLVGDRWNRARSPNIDMQITVMRQDVATLIANGQPLTLFGDNLFVDFDITTSNLPPGTRLTLGDCVLEVTPEPHTGCKQFKQRFGFDALKFTALKALHGHNLRGIHWRVIEPGMIRIGDSIDVSSRA